MKNLVEWDSIDLRVNADRINDVVRTIRVDPIERMFLRFQNGLLTVEGSVRKMISVPFSVEISELIPSGSTIRVPVRAAATFGGFPIPRFLFGLFQDKLPRGLVSYQEPATFVVSLEHFMPPFVHTEIQRIWIVDGGLAVTLGKGGADLPPSGGIDGRTRSE